MTSPAPGGGAAGFPRPFGKYTLLAHLAVGGMADVFLAQHRGPAGFEKECVIKRILPHLALDQAFVQMFLDEARLSARLSHPNIVQIFDLGQVDGDYFLAMEYVDGVNLEQVLDQAHMVGERVLPWPVALRIVCDVAAGLDYAHISKDPAGQPLGLVHRDVSPSNIMVGWGGTTKILDFGIAKANAVRKSRTEVGTIKGKVPYMSPEQLQGHRLDGRSDVFSLGVILYEATCGARPFPGETTPQLTVQILNDQPRPPVEMVEGYPPRLQEIVQRALAKRPADRWQTARDFELALEGFLASAHVSCTTYDVEAYLRRLFPEGRKHLLRVRSVVSGTDETEVSTEMPALGRVALPVEDAPGEPRDGRAVAGVRPGTGAQSKEANKAVKRSREAPPRDKLVTGVNQGPQLRLSDPGTRFEELEQEERQQRRRGGGGMMVAIALLVAATAAGLFLIRDYVMAHAPAPAAPDMAPAAAAPAQDLAPAPAAPDMAPARDLAAPAKAEPARGEKKAEEPRAVKEREDRPAREREDYARPRRPREPEPPRALPRIEPDPE